MSQIGETIRAMRAKGLSCAQIVDAIEVMADTMEAVSDHALEERRAKDRMRHARWRASQKEKANANVSHADKRDETFAETPAPLVSPLLPSPKPLTNNPPIIPPSSEKPAREIAAKAEPRGSRLSENWVLPDDWRSEARRIAFKAKTPLTDQEIDHETDKFRDHWIAAAGAKGRKCDWLAAWRTWIRNYLDWRQSRRDAPGRGGAGPIAQHGRGSIAAAAARRANERANGTDVSGEFDWGHDVEGEGRRNGDDAILIGRSVVGAGGR